MPDPPGVPAGSGCDDYCGFAASIASTAFFSSGSAISTLAARATP